MTNIPDINFNKIPNKSAKFNQTDYYEANFDKINEQIVPKVNELDAQLADIALILKNDIKNGDFLQLKTDWVEVNSTGFIQDGNYHFTASANLGRIHQVIDNYIVGDKYYITAVIKADTDKLSLYMSNNNVFVYHTGSGNFERLSMIITYMQNASTVRIMDGRTSGFTKNVVDNVLSINLTKCFGRGNEPSIDIMDEVIGKIGWFSSEKTILKNEIYNADISSTLTLENQEWRVV